jgi:hypothetical protein
VAAVALALAGCPRHEPKPPPTPEPAQPPIGEMQLPPSGTVHFEIGAITPHRADDGGDWLVESSVRNTGTRTSRDIKVWVEGRDEQGTRLARTEVLPSPQEIPPGGVATFIARLPANPSISTFHVEAVVR